MKKIIILSIIALITIITISKKVNGFIEIPESAIRFRIIPSSNSVEDIFIKEMVKERISPILKTIQTASTIEETRINIENSIPSIKETINSVLKENNYSKTFEINYGENYFPEKEYNGLKYKEGNYESLVIKIGSASGDNYWCVLFPPLCMIESKETNNVEYTFLVKEIIKKFINK